MTTTKKFATRHLPWGGAIVVMFGACGTTLDRRVEDTIRKELSHVVGPAERYDVEVAGARVSVAIADLENVQVVGTRINRQNSPIIDRLEIDMRQVVVDRKEHRLRSLSAAKAVARVLASDIAAFLDTRPVLDNVNVTLHPPEEISVTAQPSIAGYALPKAARFTVRGRLVAAANELNLQVVDFRVPGFSVGAVAKIVLEKAINPIIDLSGFPVSSEIAAVTVTDDAVFVVATGSRAPAAALRREPANSIDNPGRRRIRHSSITVN